MEGNEVGCRDGASDGCIDGNEVGCADGVLDGCIDGNDVGCVGGTILQHSNTKYIPQPLRSILSVRVAVRLPLDVLIANVSLKVSVPNQLSLFTIAGQWQ